MTTYHIGVLSRCCGGGFRDLKQLYEALQKRGVPVETKSLSGHSQRMLRKSLEDTGKIDPKNRFSYLYCDELEGVWPDREWNELLLKILEAHGRDQASSAGTAGTVTQA